MTRTRDGRHLLIAFAALEVLAIFFVHWIDTRGYMDTEIYRLGARAWLNGYQLYGDLTPESPESVTLPFIYPPFAAILFTPLAWMSETGAVLTVALCSHLAILVTAYCFAKSSPYLAPRAELVAVATAGLLPWLTVLEPARETLNYGQINLVLMALVAADCLLPHPRWPRGLLLGLAAAIKLTPLGFLLLFLLRRDFRAIAVGIGTFAVTVVIGWLAMPADAAEWWLDKMWSTGADFGSVYAGNLTVRSLLAKQSLTGVPLDSLWLGISVLLLLLAVLGIRYALRQADLPLALVINAVWVLLASPISWSHHWVWAAPALAVVGVMTVRNRWYGMALATALAALTVAIGPQWYLPNTEDRELSWTFSQQIVGNAYTLIGIGFLAAAAIAYIRLLPSSDQSCPSPRPKVEQRA